VDLVAYMLELNEVPAGTVELPADEQALMQILFAPSPGPGSD
jgi:hypothetical protein